MRDRAADDPSIAEHLRNICNREGRYPPGEICAMLVGKTQSECTACAPNLTCLGCIRKRIPGAMVSDCPVCRETPSKPCPTR